MHSSSVLEKKKQDARPHYAPTESGVPESDDSFVYMLVPRGGGLRVMRARLEELLEVAQPVVDVPDPRFDPLAHRATNDPHGIREALWGRAGMTALPEQFASQNHPRHSMQSGSRFGDIEIDPGARVVTRAGQQIALAPLEFDLLLALFRRRGAAASRQDLMREVWGGKKGVTQRTVDTHVFNLRRKLEDQPGEPAHILTVSKVGYRLKV